MNDPIVTPAGWCVPEGVEYSTADSGPSSEFPTVTVQRGGSCNWFPAPGTPEWLRQQQEREKQETIQQLVSRWIGDILKAQNALLDVCCWTALAEGWDLHIQRRYDSRFIGVEFAPRESDRTFPTVNGYTLDSWRWDEW